MENGSARTSSIRRIVALIDAAALGGGSLRYRDAARALPGAGPSTIARLLRELVAAGVLERTGACYRLGERPMFWAASVPPERDLRLLVRPALVRLSTTLDCTACLVVRWGGRITILDRVASPQVQALLPPGAFVEPNAVTMGGVFLMDRIEFDLRRSDLRPDPQAARARIEDGLRRDLFDDGGVFYRGLHRLCAPLRRDGQVVAAIGLAFRTGSVPARAHRSLRDAVRGWDASGNRGSWTP